MSIDLRGRAATAELRETARATVPPLASVVERARDRRRRTRVAVAATCAAIVGAALLTGTRTNGVPDLPATPTPSASATFGLACQMPGITCSNGRIEVSGQLVLPVSFAPVPGLNTDDLAPGDGTLTLHSTQGTPATGVTIFEDPIPVDGAPDRLVPTIAAASSARTAAWLASRPFATSTTPQPTLVGGLRGFRVDVTLRAGANLASFAHGSAAAVTFIRSGGFEAGSSSSVSPQFRTATYYLLDSPHGLVVIWVWSVDGSAADLATMSPVISSLHFG